MEILKQVQYSPYSLEQQAAILFLAIHGYLMDVAVEKIAHCLTAYLEHLNDNHAELMRAIGQTGKFSAEQEGELKTAIEQFKLNIKDKI
jgi:F-type H+-transporting ATPase subunit alpha